MCVRNVPVFASLDEAGFRAVHSLVRHMDVGRNTLLFQENEPFTSLMIVRQGMLSLLKSGPDDEAVETDTIRVGGVYGSEKLFVDEEIPRHDFSGFCEAPTAFCLIRLEDFRTLVKTDERIAFTMLRELNERLTECHRRLYAVGIKDAEKRIAYYLSSEPGMRDGRLIAKTQESIGQALFLTKETVNRKLKQLEADGVLSIEGKRKIRVQSMRDLLAKAEGRSVCGTNRRPDSRNLL